MSQDTQDLYNSIPRRIVAILRENFEGHWHKYIGFLFHFTHKHTLN